MKIPLIVLAAVLGFLLVLWIGELIYRLSLRSSAKKSERFLCRELRYIVYITGQVRAGKTTFMAGYANLRTRDLIKRAQRKIRFISLAFPSVPFDAVQKRLVEAFEAGEIDSDAMAKRLLSQGQIMGSYGHLEYDNHLSAKPVPFSSMLSDYIDAQWALMRNNYVYYYGKAFHSWITGNDAMDYSPDMMAIKDTYLNPSKKESDRMMDYHILPYSIICEDERQLSGKDCTQFMAYSKADSGAADFLRLIGQLGQETIYYVTTNQYWAADVKRERDLATEIVSIVKSVAINPFFLEMRLIRLVEVPARIVLWWKRIRHGKTDPYLVNSKARSFLAMTTDLKKRLAAHSFVLFKGLVYHNPNDFGKPAKGNPSILPLRSIIPIRYCRGSTNTFEFHSVQKMLISRSRWRLSDEPGEVRDDDLASRVLQKRIAGKAVRKRAK